MNDSFLHAQAVTQHFTLGQPRTISIAGERIFFIRSKGSQDPAGCLWSASIVDGQLTEQLLVDPQNLPVATALPEAERRRRERLRERAGGVVAYSVDQRGQNVAFTLSGELFVCQVADQRITQLSKDEAAYDPRISPDGTRVAYVSDGALKIVEVASEKLRTVAEETHPDVTWGLADFIAAEEMHRLRGFWWAPDSQAIIAEKVDNRLVQEWYIADPAQPQLAPRAIRYPAAGTKNAILALSIFSVEGQEVPVQWDNEKYEYLAAVHWGDELHITVQSRDQKNVQLLRVNPQTGQTTLTAALADPQWVELQPGLPCVRDGKVISHQDTPGARQLIVDGQTFFPDGLHLQTFCGAQASGNLYFTASQRNAKSWQLYSLQPDGVLRQLSPAGGLHDAIVADTLMVQIDRSMDISQAQFTVSQWVDDNWQPVGQLHNHAAVPDLPLRVRFIRSTERQLESALVLPADHDGQHPLPILLDPYGGPGANRVIETSRAYYEAQWYANQGFAVLITDNRGAPGVNPAWEKAIAGNLIDIVLEDQIAALQAVAAQYDFLDTSRVGIKGWSFGGYLAAYAVTRHPDIFQAAIAGAPVTDWRKYDTHYSERYLGSPQSQAAAYDACSLLQEADKLQRPLLLIHGLADDNVVVGHTLEFSAALLTAGRAHQVLPLSGATHMPTGTRMLENLEKFQLDFLRRNLGLQ